jgi:RNA polymerase sigma-70 factor, ECF subfamily
VNEIDDLPHWCEALYDAQAAALLVYGRALGLSHAESEDVLHEVFRSLVIRPTAPDRPQNYLVTAFRNRALKQKISLWRRITREFEAISWFERTSPDDPREGRAMDCLQQLPNDQREVIVLKFWNDLTFQEIAALLSISPHTAAGRYRYGLQKLKNVLHDSTYETDDYKSIIPLVASPTFPRSEAEIVQ